MAGRGMGAASKGGGAVGSGPKNKMMSTTSKKTGPAMMKDGGIAEQAMGKRPEMGKMPTQAQGKGLAKLPPGIQKRLDAGKSAPAGILRNRPTLIPTAKLAMGGVPPQATTMATAPRALPAQAAPQAAQAMAARPALPAQAVGARPFKKGGSAAKKTKKMSKGGRC